MHNFNYYVPTDVYFGKDQLSHLPELIKPYGTKVLMVYGGGSIKKTGIYDSIIKLLDESGITVYELGGVEPNPRISSVREGVRLCREHYIPVVLGVGGGSSIDCAKAIGIGVKYDGDTWDLYKNPSLIKDCLPVVAVLTIAATGSEMDGFAVITNPETKDKIGVCHKTMIPKGAIMDPTFTFSVPKFQTASGIADMMSHSIDTYFNVNDDAFVPNAFSEALLRTCIKYGKTAVEEPENYEARANLMWCSSLAINGINKAGVDFSNFSWTCHPIEHPLSAFYDVTHGAALAVLTPNWMTYILSDSTVDKFVAYGVNVWGIDASKDKFDIAKEAIEKTHDFFQSLGLPMTLKELGVAADADLPAMAKKAFPRAGVGYVHLDENDVVKILEMSL